MGCRCRDIPKCSSDISRIEEILSYFRDSDNTNESVSMEISVLASECSEAFSCVNMQELIIEEKLLNKTETELLPELLKDSKNKISDLRDELSSMKSEDRHYHEKKKHHHDD